MSEFIHTSEIAQRLGVSSPTIRDWVKRGLIPPPAFKVGRNLRWSREQIERWIKQQTGAACS